MFPTTARCSTSSATTATTLLDLITTDSSDYGWGKGTRAARVPVHGQAAGPVHGEEPRDRLRVHGGEVRGGVRARRTTVRRDALRSSRARCATRPRRVRARRASSRCVPDGAGPRAVLLRGRQLGRRHGARRRAAARSSPATRATAATRWGFAAREPVTPWMGADTARHYQWYPWHNAGHYEAWSRARHGRPCATRALLSRWPGARRAPRDERLPRRHPVHLVLERSHGLRSRRRRALPAMTGDRRFVELSRARSTGCSAPTRGARRW